MSVLLASNLVVSIVPTTLLAFSAGFAGVMLKVFGVIALFGAYLLYAASRDPVRYVAVIDAFAFLLLAVAAIDVYALVVVHLTFAPWVILRTVVRVALAIALIVLRPRGA